MHTIEKQRIIVDIWSMNQSELCEYFTNYELFPQKVFSIEEILDATNLKLIKNDGKIFFGQI